MDPHLKKHLGVCAIYSETTVFKQLCEFQAKSMPYRTPKTMFATTKMHVFGHPKTIFKNRLDFVGMANLNVRVL